MHLIKEDFLPKRPTRARLVSAAGQAVLALLCILAVLAKISWAPRAIEDAFRVEIFLVVMMLFVTRASLFEWAWLRVLLMGWYAVAFIVLFATLSYFLGDAWPLVAVVLLLAARARTLVMPKEFVARELLFARAILSFALIWIAALAALPAGALSGGDVYLGFYAGLYFALQALVEMFGILDAPGATGRARL